MLSHNFAIVGAVISFLFVLGYVVDTLKGKVQPNGLSWFILSLAPLIACAAEIRAGVGLRALTTFSAGFGPLLIFLASFVNKKAYWKLSRFDITCGALSLCALVLWQLTGDGNVAIVLSIMADCLACLPILVKGWKVPHSESPWPFWSGVTSSGLGLLVLDRLTFADWAFPAYIVTICLILIAVISSRQRVVSPVDDVRNEPALVVGDQTV